MRQVARTIWLSELPDTPLGAITVGVSEVGVARVAFARLAEMQAELPEESLVTANPPTLLAVALEQIREYLLGGRRGFELPIDWRGMTPFELAVRQVVAFIPYGEVRTYAQVARAVGKPGAAVAVGAVQAANPLPLIIPCHRVLGSDGKLHGFNAPDGVKTKAWLLQHEGYTLLA